MFLGCLVAGLPDYWVVGWLFFGVVGFLVCCVVVLLGSWILGFLDGWVVFWLFACWVAGLLGCGLVDSWVAGLSFGC